MPGPGADDPQPLGRLVDSLVTEQDWSERTRVGAVFGRWEALVGPDIAAHCAPADPHRGRAAGRRGVHGLGHPAAAAGPDDPRQAARAGRRGRRDPVARCRTDGPQLEEGPALGARAGAARHVRLRRHGHDGASAAMSSPRDRDGPTTTRQAAPGGEPAGATSAASANLADRRQQPRASDPPGRRLAAAGLGPARRAVPDRHGAGAGRRPGSGPPAPRPPLRRPGAGLFGGRRREPGMERAFTLRDRPRRRAGVGAAARLDDLRRQRPRGRRPARPDRRRRRCARARRPGRRACCAAAPARWTSSRSTSSIRWGGTSCRSTRSPRPRCSGPCPGSGCPRPGFWKHRTGGLVPIASGNEVFDARWLLLAAEDSPQVRRLVAGPRRPGAAAGHRRRRRVLDRRPGTWPRSAPTVTGRS